MATVEDVWIFGRRHQQGTSQRHSGGQRSNWEHEASFARMVTVPMSLMAMSVTRPFFHICRMASGVPATREAAADLGNTVRSSKKELVDLKGARVASSAEEKRVKLNTILSQTRDTEASTLDTDKVNLAYARHQAVYGAESVPPPDAEPTTEQLSGLAHVLAALAALYVDFAEWRPHGHRIQKKLKLTALQLRSDGTWGALRTHWAVRHCCGRCARP